MDRWQGRVAFVSGASSGIGAAACRALVAHGMTVVGCARNDAKIRALAAELEGSAPGQLVAIKCDLSVESDILSMFDEIRARFGRLDVCVNNAGFSHDSPLLSGKTEDWKNMMDVNVLALCICTREAVKLMKEKSIEDGQIIHISSILGHQLSQGMSGINFYSGTKFMVRALAEGLRRELKEAGLKRIRIASISPGRVETQFLSHYTKDEGLAKSIYSSVQAIRAEDVAETVLNILTTPPHVEILDILMRPTDQPL